MYNKITAVKAKKIMDDHEKVTVLDVREPDELVEGYIENSKLIPLGEVSERAEKELDKNIPVLVYCRSGRRSEMAGKVLSEMGYKVYDFGGIIDWPFDKIM